MNYEATIGKETHEVDVVEKGEGLYQITLDGRTQLVDARELFPGGLSLLVDSSSYFAEFERGDDSHTRVLVRGQVFTVEMLDERARRMRKAGSRFALEGPQTVLAPMPGKVVKVLVKVGDEVAEGQGLVVVEAMKMENELAAPRAGKISAVHAREGASVEGGAPLLVVE